MDRQRDTIPGFRPLPPPRQQHSPPPSPKRNAPGSPAKRRRFFQESEESEGDMSIENFIYLTDPYRSTTAKIKFPLDLKVTPGPERHRNVAMHDREFHDQLRSTLADHQIEYLTADFNCFSKPGYPGGGDIPVTTLLIHVSLSDEDSSVSWSAAKRDVQDLLETSGLDDAEVEIQDIHRAYAPRLLPIKPSDPHISAFEVFSDRLAEFLLDNLGSNWVSMTLFEVQHNVFLEFTRFEVVVFVKPFSIHNWQDLRRQIHSHFLSDIQDEEAKDIDVVFLPGLCHIAHDEEEMEKKGKPLLDLEPWPAIGASIGVEGDIGGGTLGGYFLLHQPEKTKLVFLTCSHVVTPGLRASEDEQAQFKRDGVTLAADNVFRSVMQYMAQADIHVTKLTCQNQLRDISGPDGTIARRLNDISLRQDIGMKTSALEVQMEREVERKNHLQNALAICDSLPLSLGKVGFATSEAATSDPQILDFALVTINGNNEAKFRQAKPNGLRDFGETGLKGPAKYGLQSFKKLQPQVIDELGTIQKGEWYFKKGRTTGYTEGLCHGVENFVNLAKVRTIYDGEGNPVAHRHVGITKELIICDAKLGITAIDIQDFCDVGDSGSLIVNEVSQACGILYGTLYGLCGRPGLDARTSQNIGNYYGAKIGLVTSMDVVEKHLQLRENAKLEVVTDVDAVKAEFFA